MGRGGARSGAGRKRKPVEDHIREGTFQPVRHAVLAAEGRSDGFLAQKIGPSPLMLARLGLGPADGSSGEHFAAFARLCHHTIGESAGEPFELEDWQREFVEEALAFRDGRRVWRRVVLGIPRKNGKSTLVAALCLYMGSELDGENEPEVICAAGSREQASTVFNIARSFVDMSPELRGHFLAQKIAITCPGARGVVRRVAADGKLQHGLNPHVVAIDELHSFETPKQIELWKALTTAQGFRRDPLVIVITTAGSDLHNSLLGDLYKRAQSSRNLEKRDGMWIARNPETGLLVHWHGADQDADFDDMKVWKGANPASWRTLERCQEDHDDEFNDQPSKRRLFLNQWTAAKERWLSHERWSDLAGDVGEPTGDVFVGIDAATKNDTTAVAWAWQLDDGRIAINARVWSAKPHNAHDVLCPNGLIDLDLIERFVIDLAGRVSVREVVYDPRFFTRSGQLLEDAGIVTAPIEQNSAPMADAYQRFYDAVMRDQSLVHPGNPILDAHVEAAAGVPTERGWKVSKLKSRKIDALVAAVIAHYRASLNEGGAVLSAADLAGIGW